MKSETGEVKNVLIACTDGLTGFPEAIQAVFPKTVLYTVQEP